MNGPVFWRNFKNAETIARAFAERDDNYEPVIDSPEVPYPTDAEVLFAWYTYEDYSGRAFVLFERAGVLYENHGRHCSCYRLEGQWSPEPTTWAALAMRVWCGHFGTDCDDPPSPAQRTLETLIATRNPRA